MLAYLSVWGISVTFLFTNKEHCYIVLPFCSTILYTVWYICIQYSYASYLNYLLLFSFLLYIWCFYIMSLYSRSAAYPPLDFCVCSKTLPSYTYIYICTTLKSSQDWTSLIAFLLITVHVSQRLMWAFLIKFVHCLLSFVCSSSA